MKQKAIYALMMILEHSCLTNTYFLEVSEWVSSKVVNNGSSRSKQISKINTSETIDLKQKRRTKECSQNNSCFDDDFRMFMPFVTTVFLEVSVHSSSKIATNGSFRGKNPKT